jgi:hypothetical protein
MAKIDKDSLGYLGFNFQTKLLLQLLTDKTFADSIIPILNQNYFEDEYHKIIMATVKNAYEKNESLLNMGSLETRLFENSRDDIQRKFLISALTKIKDVEVNDMEWVQETAMTFCKQQELKKAITQIQSILDKGEHYDFQRCESIIKAALEHGENKDNGINVTDNIEAVLAEDFRKPIATGIHGLDEAMDGGLSKGELAVILASSGVGKSTSATKLANSAKNLGYNVLQIFFEDKIETIQRKQYACWTGHNINDIHLYKDEIRALKVKIDSEPGIIKLKKFPSGMTTIPMIKQFIKKQISKGFKPDLLVLDYVDCLRPSEEHKDKNVGEGFVMRELEAMISELDIACWTMIQGNRGSINSDVVDLTHTGGSLTKIQVAHFVLSIGKPVDKLEDKTATATILKSRFGPAGKIFQDILFDNARVQIDFSTSTPKTRTEYKKDIADSNQDRVNEVMNAMRARQEAMG